MNVINIYWINVWKFQRTKIFENVFLLYIENEYFHNYICIFRPEWLYELRWVRLSNLHAPIPHSKCLGIVGDLWFILWFYISKPLKTYKLFIYLNAPHFTFLYPFSLFFSHILAVYLFIPVSSVGYTRTGFACSLWLCL